MVNIFNMCGYVICVIMLYMYMYMIIFLVEIPFEYNLNGTKEMNIVNQSCYQK